VDFDIFLGQMPLATATQVFVPRYGAGAGTGTGTGTGTGSFLFSYELSFVYH